MSEFDADDLVVPSVAALRPGAVLLTLWAGCSLVHPVDLELVDTVSAWGSGLPADIRANWSDKLKVVGITTTHDQSGIYIARIRQMVFGQTALAAQRFVNARQHGHVPSARVGRLDVGSEVG